MKSKLLIVMLAALTWSGRADAQLIEQRTDGSHRICIYRASPAGTDVRQVRVGMAEECAAYLRTEDRSSGAPPTARLVESRVENGQRICSYAQRGRNWAYHLALTQSCPVAAGMLDVNSRPR